MPYPRRVRATPVLALVAAAALAAPAFAAPRVLRVPGDARTLAAAIAAARDGDTIELAAGTYPAPPRGFSFDNLRRALTVRAAPGATVILDGGGRGPIAHVENGRRERNRRITFEDLVFRHGLATAERVAGGVTVTAGEASFVRCRFVENRAAARTSGGGALRVRDGSDVRLVASELRGNAAGGRGGAVELVASRLDVRGGAFRDNHADLAPGSNSLGGAIYVVDGVLRVSDAIFERNAATGAGGAVYAIAHWLEPATRAVSDLGIVRSTFRDNAATEGPGGAIHVENQTTLRLRRSLLAGNRAVLGGGLDVHRAVVAIEDTIFRANRTQDGAALGSGGAVFASSNENAADTRDRRPASLAIARSLFEGGAPEGSAAGGGCVAIGGDASRLRGENGVEASGTVAEHRAHLAVTASVFRGCEAGSPAVSGMGGAILATLADVAIADSLFLDSRATGANGVGGAIDANRETVLTVTRSVFAHDAAGFAGGALFASGSTLDVADSGFLRNEVAGGRSPLRDARGAAIYTMPFLAPGAPAAARDVAGVVRDSLFAGNAGVAIWDVDPPGGPIDDVRYDGNDFHHTATGGAVYVDSLAAPGGLAPGGLDGLVVYRPGRASTDKSRVANRALAAATAGTLLAAPAVVDVGAPAAGSTWLHYAWTGRAATLDGVPLADDRGAVAAGPGVHTLIVDGVPVANVTVAAP